MSKDALVHSQVRVSKDEPLAIVATGMVTGVGFDTASACAAIRAAIDNFQETRFMDDGGEWIMGCEVPLGEPQRGTRKLARMVARALVECADGAGVNLRDTPVLMCLSEKERPGRLKSLGNRVFFETQEELEMRFTVDSEIIERGRVGAFIALQLAHRMIYQNGHKQVLIVGVDSMLTAPVIKKYQELDRLLTSKNSDGFIPGEGAGAILVRGNTESCANRLMCLGLGFSNESAVIGSNYALKGEGLTAALRQALLAAQCNMNDMDFRIVDVTGEQYWFKETSLVMSRLLRTHKTQFPLWHITDCVGETGAAVALLSIAYLKVAFEKRFAPGINVYQQASNDDSRRAAAVFCFNEVN